MIGLTDTPAVCLGMLLSCLRMDEAVWGQSGVVADHCLVLLIYRFHIPELVYCMAGVFYFPFTSWF